MGLVRLQGVTFCDAALTHVTTILFTGADSVTRLIDINGNEIKQWPYPGVPARMLDPDHNHGRQGHVGVQLSAGNDARGGIYGNGTIGQLDWNGGTVWEWGDGVARQNHDWELLPNGNWLVLNTVPRVVPALGDHVVGDQGLVEVNPAGAVVWDWRSGDHLSELGLSTRGLELLREAASRDPNDPWGCLEMNSASTLGPNRWFEKDAEDQPEQKSIFHPENIIISFRKANIVAIIDRQSSRIVWRIGPYYDEAPGSQHQRIRRYDVPRPLDQTSGQHNPHMVRPGLAGAGNILLFDNQGGAGYPHASLGIYAGSRILEIDPRTKQIVWQYTAEDSGLPPWTFFSSFVSNAQRLPNGNTLITEGMQGRLFQVTPEGKIVWEYYSPYVGSGVAGEPEVDTPRIDGVDRLSVTPLVYRAQAVPQSWLPDDVKPVEAVAKDMGSNSTCS